MHLGKISKSWIIRALFLPLLALTFPLGSSVTALGNGPDFAAQQQLDQQELMQGNSAYRIESYFSPAPPDTVLKIGRAHV